MKVLEFIAEFSKKETLPIDLDDDVIPKLIEAGLTDEIYPFWDSQLPSGSLFGHFVHEEVPDGIGGYKRVATVTYGQDSDEMQRLVACKETLHLFDPVHCRVSTEEEIEDLIGKMVLPPDLVEPISDGHKAFTDRLAILQAVAVLFPLAAREIVLPAYKAEKMSLKDVAELAELPEFIVAMVMDENWPKTLASVMTVIEHIHQP